MPIRNLNQLFSSPFYIDGRYAAGFAPVLLAMLKGGVNLASESDPKVSIEKMAAVGDNGGAEGTVAVVSLKHPIVKYNLGYPGTKQLLSEIKRLDADPSVAGIVLDIDSGGGQVYGTPEFFDNLRKIQKPLVAYTDGYMCSAAYYIAAACDYLIANERADAIGSIGAYAQIVDFKGLWEHFGAKVHTIYAEESTEKNKAYREVLEGDYKSYITTSLNPTVATFIKDMKSVRPQLTENVFKGGTWEGPEALKLNLVDSLGTLQDAIAKVFDLDKSNSNKPKTTMSKPNSYPNLEASLGLSAPLATNDNGSYLNEEQKSTLENTLAANATTLKNAQDAKAQAEADLQAEKDTHAAALSDAAAPSVEAIASLQHAATLAGVEGLAEEATTAEIATALTARIEELNGKPGDIHTNGADGADDDDPTPSYVNREAYKKMFK